LATLEDNGDEVSVSSSSERPGFNTGINHMIIDEALITDWCSSRLE